MEPFSETQIRSTQRREFQKPRTWDPVYPSSDKLADATGTRKDDSSAVKPANFDHIADGEWTTGLTAMEKLLKKSRWNERDIDMDSILIKRQWSTRNSPNKSTTLSEWKSGMKRWEIGLIAPVLMMVASIYR